MYKILTVVFILVFVISGQVYAEETKYSLSFGAFTKHFGGDHNENNRLIGVSYKDWYLAEFRNSYNKETVFVGYGFKTKKLKRDDWWVRGNLYTGLLYGYGDKAPSFRGVSPGLFPTGSLGWKSYSFELGAMPNGVFGFFKVEF